MGWVVHPYWFLIAGIWYTVNGLLHDVFVILRHKGPYDRELLRLLMDGHVLLLSGLLCFVCWQMQKQGLVYAGICGAIVAGFMLAYCAMIMPFLKSIVTVLISVMLLAASVKFWGGH